jgi:hypothetical protein
VTQNLTLERSHTNSSCGQEMYAHKQDIKKHRQTCTYTVSDFLNNESTLELMRQKKKLSTYLDEYICEYICLTIKKKETVAIIIIIIIIILR